MADPSTPQAAEASERRSGRKFGLVLLGVLVLLIVAGAVGIGLYMNHQRKIDEALKDAIARTDQLDAAWRMEDIDRQRSAMPDEQNAATHIKAAWALLATAKSKDYHQFLDQAYEELLPQVQVNPEWTERLRKGLEPLEPAAIEATKAVPLKKGWYPLAWSPDFIMTLVPHWEWVREVAYLMQCRAVLQSQDGRHDEAWQSTMAILAAGRSLGDEPLLNGQLIRMSLQKMTARGLERCLAQGTVSDALLAGAQQQLAEEAAQPLYLFGLRGERAGMHMLMTNIENGAVDLKTFYPMAVGMNRRGKGSTGILPVLPQLEVNARVDHTWLLHFHNEALECLKLPPDAMLARLRALEATATSDAPGFAHKLVASVSRFGATAIRSRVLLECTRAGIGCERFRLQHGRWPTSLEEVVAAKLLDAVPVDHFGGKPLRYRKTADGVVIYSAGPDGKHAGEARDAESGSDAAAVELEFRLWDENQRRRVGRGE
jgi:hypothetical protein